MASKQSDFHPDEWAARVQLASCYRVFAMLGWVEMIYNHITLRVPESASGKDKHFLINPFGLHYSEVTASNLVKIDLQGRKMDGASHKVNPAGFVVHSCIHDNIANAHCVMHTHTTSGLAVACQQGGLVQNNFYSAQLHNMVAYHDFEGITVHADEGPRVLKSIGNKKAVILRNHGLLSWGSTLPQAFVILWTLQRACDVQLATLSMGPAIQISEDIAQKCTLDALQYYPDNSGGGGDDVFAAMQRLVDRIDDSYRL
ncbi:MAG: class II aldolase/adducin family protein [Betaproteobacteria bacterium]|nr:class II aldolase/adducin family protein [Betaproteobacteria bacterium]NBT67517.1 class II aldolase/adducin family protein [Betaproteobacteria bacterium]NBY06745.1 class II aldolase/adducin family protein [Betaproteobacteria bacterium]